MKPLLIISFILATALSAFGESRQAALQLTLPTGETVDYLRYTPGEHSETPPPLLLFLHGGGESGDDLDAVKTHGPPFEIEEGRDFPMIVVSPLNPDAKRFWDEDRLARFLDALADEMEFDPTRLYLAGMSRGGYGAYRLAMENPDRFAALLVLCGAAPAPYANWLGDLPTWIIHGEKDTSIPVSESIEMAAAMEKNGGDVTLTLLPEAGHDVWTDTFKDPQTLAWLLQHHREIKK